MRWDKNVDFYTHHFVGQVLAVNSAKWDEVGWKVGIPTAVPATLRRGANVLEPKLGLLANGYSLKP